MGLEGSKPKHQEQPKHLDAAVDAKVQEATPENIESADKLLTHEVVRFRGNMAQMGDGANVEKALAPTTLEQIQQKWETAKTKALGAFLGLGAAGLVTLSAAQYEHEAAFSSLLQSGDAGTFNRMMQTFDSLQASGGGVIAAAIAVPALMIGLAKARDIIQKRRLYSNPASA